MHTRMCARAQARLKCGYIDLYQIHNWDSQVKPEVSVQPPKPFITHQHRMLTFTKSRSVEPCH